MQKDSAEQQIWAEIEADRLKWESLYGEAEEIVQNHGRKETDDDYQFQIEEEAYRLWEEDIDRERKKFFRC